MARHPGPPRHNRFRYDAFRRIMGTAARAYCPTPADFPVTLVHVGKGDLVQRTAQFATDVSVYVVGGDHHTMLEPPEVAKVAAAITEAAQTAFAASFER